MWKYSTAEHSVPYIVSRCSLVQVRRGGVGNSVKVHSWPVIASQLWKWARLTISWSRRATRYLTSSHCWPSPHLTVQVNNDLKRRYFHFGCDMEKICGECNLVWSLDLKLRVFYLQLSVITLNDMFVGSVTNWKWEAFTKSTLIIPPPEVRILFGARAVKLFKKKLDTRPQGLLNPR